MARLFVFAIGGTGSRVLKSLTFLLASGVKPRGNETYEVVPIIIDPHKANEDLKRTERLLSNYQAITAEAGVDNVFFGTRITTLNNLVESDHRLSGSFTFDMQEVSGKKFREYIDFNQLGESSKALADFLFSGKSINKRGDTVDLLDVEMDIGFVGNPNIGSVVLNQFKDSDEFREFASCFNAGDRVFIISSIFGGTGAAGFPIILKNIRDAVQNKNIDSRGFLQNAPIGAITVLPYFNIEKDADSPIQKSDFVAKSRSALHYYKDNVTGNNSVNALYYLGDDYSGKPYPNDPGDSGQRNDAHFAELAAALAIIDFMELPPSELVTDGGKAVKPIYKEFSIRNDAAEIRFADLEDETERIIALRLSQMALFRKYLDEQFRTSLEKEPWSMDKPELNRRFADSLFLRTHISEFLASYGDWLTEMAGNKRAFAPFNLAASLEALVVGRTVKKGLLERKVDFSYMNDRLSKLSKGKTYPSPAQKLLQLFFAATQDILNTKFGLSN